jgi:branched-chain amino acid transport system ATP-binding protein
MTNGVTEAPTPTPAAGAPPSKDLLVARSVSKVFGGLVAVSDIDFSIPRLSIVSIIGPNGAGKTTFFNMLTGLYKPTTGTITRASRRSGPIASSRSASPERSRTSGCSRR